MPVRLNARSVKHEQRFRGDRFAPHNAETVVKEMVVASRTVVKEKVVVTPRGREWSLTSGNGCQKKSRGLKNGCQGKGRGPPPVGGNGAQPYTAPAVRGLKVRRSRVRTPDDPLVFSCG